jgi:hypothetical protein
MFHTERTELKQIFGATIGDAIRLIKQYQESVPEEERGLLYKGTTGRHYTKIISGNPHSTKLLRQYPHLINMESLQQNPSIYASDIIYEERVHSSPPYYNEYSPIIDTILTTDDPESIPPFSRQLLSCVPKAVPFLSKNQSIINWKTLSSNPEALYLIEENPEKISYNYLSANPNPRAIELLRENITKINWESLSRNPCKEAIELLMEYPNKIVWNILAENKSPFAFPLIERGLNQNKFNWYGLSMLNKNPMVFHLLKQTPHRIYFRMLCKCAETQEQFDYIRENMDEIDWEMISSNTSQRALKFLEEFPDKIAWHYSLGCQNVFETTANYNYEGIRQARHDLHSEFHAWAGHPSKMTNKWKDWGFDGAVYDEEESREDDIEF